MWCQRRHLLLLGIAMVTAFATFGCQRRQNHYWHSPPGYPLANELFTIDLPANVRPGSRDLIPDLPGTGDGNSGGEWLGPDWRIEWHWWSDDRAAGTAEPPRPLRTGREVWKAWAIYPWLDKPKGDASSADSVAIVFWGRRYRWKHQLLQVEFSRIEPSDTLAAERLLASVKFEPKGRWR